MIAWIDCSAGASGDMLLGGFLDAGASLEAVNAAVAAVDPTLSVTVEPTQRHALRATKATVRVDGSPHPEGPAEHITPADHPHAHDHPHDHPHDHAADGQPADGQAGGDHGHGRAWRDVRALLQRAALDEAVRDRALDVFGRLARAEASAHGVEPDDVHFHEVGALDAIADIVGVSAAVHSLGLSRIVVSPVVLGGGTQIRGSHGGIPVPGPAVLAVLGEVGAPVLGGPAPYEMTTTARAPGRGRGPRRRRTPRR